MIVALAFIMFAFGFALDFADTRHKLAVEARHAHVAASWSVTMYLLGVSSTFAVFKITVWLVVPEVVGLYVGSVVALRTARRTSKDARQGQSCTSESV